MDETIEEVKEAYALLFAENSTLRKDAERYRWLKSRNTQVTNCGPDLAFWNECRGTALRGFDADEAIDNAMGNEC